METGQRDVTVGVALEDHGELDQSPAPLAVPTRTFGNTVLNIQRWNWNRLPVVVLGIGIGIFYFSN